MEKRRVHAGTTAATEPDSIATRKLEELLRDPAAVSTGDAAGVLPILVVAAAEALEVPCVSVWQLSEDGSRLQCVERFDSQTTSQAHVNVIHQGPYQSYFKSLDTCHVLALEGPPEAADSAGIPLFGHTAATLDVPVRVRGRLVAMLRWESGEPRGWSLLERWMATAAADFFSRMLQTREVLRLERELRVHRQHLDDLVESRTSQVVRTNADLQRAVDDLELTAVQSRKSEDDLRRLFSAAPVPMLLIRRHDDRVVLANQTAATTLGQSVDELLTVSSADLFIHPSDRADMMTTLDRQGVSESMEVQLAAGGGGGAFWALLSARPVLFEGGAAVMIGFSDLTAQKAVEHQLRFLATRDPLTQAFNRHHFWQLAQTEMARVRRYRRPLSIAMLDADQFKQLNDQYGHDVGDRALIQIVEACRSTLRKNDVLARYGGEEFIVLFPETPGEGARLVMERLRAQVEATPVKLDDDGGLVTFTVSAGVAGHVDEDDFDALLKRADEALYQAKRAGRNCVVAG